MNILSKAFSFFAVDPVQALAHARTAACCAPRGSARQRQAVKSLLKHVDAVAVTDPEFALATVCDSIKCTIPGSPLQQRAVASFLKHVDVVAATDPEFALAVARPIASGVSGSILQHRINAKLAELEAQIGPKAPLVQLAPAPQP